MVFRWTPQHDIAMFRYASKEESDFYIYNTRKIGKAIELWGAPTARILMGLAARLEMKLIKRSDEISTAISEVFVAACTGDGTIPTREKGEWQGEGIPCRYGVGCKRRDCWFMHPKLETPTRDLVRKDDDGISSEYIVDHCIEKANGKKNLIKLIDYYQLSMKTDRFDVTRALIDSQNKYVSSSVAEKFIHGEAKKGNSMAQYIWGKMLGDPAFTCLGNDGVQEKTMIKFWTSSALAGNAMAQMGLAKVNHEAGFLPVGIHWYKRALSSAALPEAAYHLGVAYGKVEYPKAGVPVQYKQAAKYYTYALGPSLPNVDPYAGEFNPDDMDHSLMFSVMVLGPGNTLQQEYQTNSIHNLGIVERYIESPYFAPVLDTQIAPHPVESTETCGLCDRRPNEGEKELASCKRCYNVKYCNAICQRGHWTEGHKAECQACQYRERI